MDNRELDNILKEKLNNEIKPSQEFEKKITEKIEEEKNKRLSDTTFQKVQTLAPKSKKTHNYKTFAKILSIAAAVLIVFTLGMNVKTAPIIGDEANAELISIR